MRRFRVNVDGQFFEVEVEEITADAAAPVKTAVNPASPVTASAAPKQEVAPSKPATNGNSNGIYAPMPGNILSVKVKEGEQVKAGQVLMVLEAMKMENEIVAPKDGVIDKIYTAAGQSVSTNDPLIAMA
ncbi:biotin/lipoyl-containing protein [Thermoactinomyces mirandus]|uniref:Biotin/lipoyl-binding protein n=1 Tax=Thermoactinomyces mirandus TaxID=2756294 RepID=A0A7W2ASE1_9BACL|nr:biotin/lipoyl-containing protein [Thermoactinomyces mirandus]MBA4603322.1 biotin/lipoyl-binding protein [Thermoactinomyces mirandus]